MRKRFEAGFKTKVAMKAVFARPNLSKPATAHKIYPYLLRDTTVSRPNQVWCADITYIRLSYGFAYLVAIMDWYSRYILIWRISNILDSLFCLEALDEVFCLYGQPEIFNTNQGS